MIALVQERLQRHGLVLFGGWHPGTDETLPGRPGTALIVGNVGSTIYEHLQASPEFRLPEPLDRWTRRIVEEIAAEVGASAAFPFDGPPFHPFQQWAMRADPRYSISPLRLLVHTEFGLWTALRAALLFNGSLDLPEMPAVEPPCPTCPGWPCLSACPGGAFVPGRYDAIGCRTQLGTLSGQDCMMGGCLARRACPIGSGPTYSRSHAAFHMRAYRSAPLPSSTPQRSRPI